jgi:hypothetical protein
MPFGVKTDGVGRTIDFDREHVLTDLIAQRGPSSETYGLLGRVYKDLREAA